MLTALCIDTITSAAGITLIHGDSAHHSPLDPKMASEGIIELIDKVMKLAGVENKDLNAIMVIKGPGSFTGLRVGISVANQFSHQLKIPIFGLKTDEWWHLRTDEEKVYLQSMNKEEVYVSDEKEARIINVEALKEMGKRKWVGELRFDHQDKLPASFEEIKKLDSTDETWKKAVKDYSEDTEERILYELIEPFYGKAPNITQAKN